MPCQEHRSELISMRLRMNLKHNGARISHPLGMDDRKKMPLQMIPTVKIQAESFKLLGKSKHLRVTRLDFHTYCTALHAWIFTLKLNIPGYYAPGTSDTWYML